MDANETVREGWAIVDLLGHKRLCGRLELLGDGRYELLIPATRRERRYDVVAWQARRVTFYGGSVYEIAWCSQERMQAALDAIPIHTLWPTAPDEPKCPAFEVGMVLSIDVGTGEPNMMRRDFTAADSPEGVRFTFTDGVDNDKPVAGLPERWSRWATSWDKIGGYWDADEERDLRCAVLRDLDGMRIWPPEGDKAIVEVRP